MAAGRIALWVSLVLAVGTTTALALWPWGETKPAEAPAADIGGPFTLTATDGSTLTRDDILGRPHAVFFGYTFCPDICPTTLFEMTGHLAAMGDAADALDVYFISVDAERDTPQHLGQYLQAFDPRIHGLTGTRERIDEAVAGYRVNYRIHSRTDGGHFLIDHTASVLLFDANGRFAGTIGYGDDADTALAKLERLAAGA